MKNKIAISEFIFISILIVNIAFAQMPDYFSSEQQKQSKEPFVTPKSVSETNAVASKTIKATIPSASVNPYDPALDNHLLAPSSPIGLFGQTIKEVEQHLRNMGAKNYSYAFGKYSRMSLASYLITIYFDKKRIVSGVSIVPKPPYKKIEPMAREFFLKAFLQGQKPVGFKSQMSSALIEFKYVGY